MAEQLAVVTGASSGIGFALAKVFAENGFDLVIVAEDAAIADAARELEAIGVMVKAVQKDLTKFDDVMAFWREVEGEGRTVEAVAVNAGSGVGGYFWEEDLEKQLNLVRLNVESTTHVLWHAAKTMVKQGRGRILVTASIVSEMVAPKEAVYAASKAFDLSLAKSLRYELKDKGVTVTALQPGPVDTKFFDRAGMSETKVGTDGKKDSEPYDVAQQGFKALMAGDEHVYAASLMTKVQGALMGLVPEGLQAAAHEKMTEPAEK